jgi:CRP/FNR family cyclic AMP-dependent transcriptional regulator
MAAAIIKEICSKLRNLTDLHADQLATDGAKRLAMVLHKLFLKWGEPLENGEIRLDHSFSQSDLGDFAGLARENVNRRLRSWTQSGVLRTDGSYLVLSDPVQLERLAND